MKNLLAVLLLVFFPGSLVANAQTPTRVWGLLGWGDNWRGTSQGVYDIAEQVKTIPGVEFVHVYNYWETQRVADEIMASPSTVKITIYGYSCGANSMTTIAYGLIGHRTIDALAGIQESLWCGGWDLGSNVIYGQVTYGGCGQTLGLGCKKLKAGPGFVGTILNINRPERHGTADNDPLYQQDVISAIQEVAMAPLPPTNPPPEGTPGWEHYGHGHALARQGLATMLKGYVLFKKGTHEIVCHHKEDADQCQLAGE